MRLTQSLFQPDTVRLHCFVDDPIASIRGTPSDRKRCAAVMILVWEALNFGLAYRKGQLSSRAVWIGGTLEFTASGIDAAIKESIVTDITDALTRFEGTNVVSRKELLSFTSRANHAAGLLLTLRPFLQPLWAAISSANSGPANTVWVKQIEHSLSWIRALFKAQIPGSTRTFSLEQFRNAGPSLEIGTDASPWGLGGWLASSGVITHYFYSAVTQDDLDLYKIERGSCVGQQVLEGLAILVALRLWHDPSTDLKAQIQVRGDTVGALTLLIKMRPHTTHQTIIARELALAVSDFSFPPKVVHTPGVAHKVADGLSRMFDPNHQDKSILSHPALRHAQRTIAPDRPRSWYRALESR
jgi:hypothetical protein